jgi:hypothetical protein
MSAVPPIATELLRRSERSDVPFATSHLGQGAADFSREQLRILAAFPKVKIYHSLCDSAPIDSPLLRFPRSTYLEKQSQFPRLCTAASSRRHSTKATASGSLSPTRKVI